MSYGICMKGNGCVLLFLEGRGDTDSARQEAGVLTLVVNQAEPAVELEACAKSDQHQPVCGLFDKPGNLQAVAAST